ncbi:MAG TPA: YtxH domain-containing protein [Longimicrobium sp.]|nr:YtxH domain-containing protein [Longimicrobium sp.]
MRDDEELPQIVIESRGGGAGVFLLGALVGAGVALLLAPRPGAETQRELRAAARRLRSAAGEGVGDAREAATDLFGRARERMGDSVALVRGRVEEKVDRARQAVETGRHAAREARTELQRRVDEAKAAYRAGNGGGAGSGRDAVPPPPAVVITEVTREPDAGDLAR